MVRIYETTNYLYDMRDVIFSTHSVVRIYDNPNYLYDMGVTYFVHIRRLENMTPPTIYTIRLCHIFYSFGG